MAATSASALMLWTNLVHSSGRAAEYVLGCLVAQVWLGCWRLLRFGSMAGGSVTAVCSVAGVLVGLSTSSADHGVERLVRYWCLELDYSFGHV